MKKKETRSLADKLPREDMAEAPYYYRLATFLNSNPDELEQLFEQQNSLETFANIFGMLKRDVRSLAVKTASRLIIKIAKQIADTGYRSGRLKLVNGFRDGVDIELDKSLEKYTEEPQQGILDSLVSYVRQKEKKAFVLIFDHSYSMKGLKILLAAITAASIVQHFKRDYAILAFSNKVTVLKGIDDGTGPEEILKKLFALELYGDTDIRMALEAGLRQLYGYERKAGLLLTDGAWNKGGDPLVAVAKFDKLSVIAFPPAKQDKIETLALKGKGDCSFVKGQSEIAGAILKCLR